MLALPPSRGALSAWLALASVAASLLLSGCGGSEETSGSQAAVPAAAVEPGHRPNVVWVLLDALRADHLHCYGYERETSPHIDGLAERGVLFERNYAQGANTLLSVPTYLTGRFFPAFYQDASQLNIWHLRRPHPRERLASTLFARNGYATAMFSASPWYSEDSRLGSSFDTFHALHHSETAAGATAHELDPQLFDWIRQHAAGPFFLYVHSLDTHAPRYAYNTRTTWLDPRFPAERDRELRGWHGAPFDERDRRHLANLYDGGIAHADAYVGEIQQELERLGIEDDTILLVTADHGEVLAEDGETLGHPGTGFSDEQLLTPLIIAGPGFPKGARIHGLAQNADILPTLVDVIGLETDAAFDGASLARAIASGDTGRAHEYAFAKTEHAFLNKKPTRVLVAEEHKIVAEPDYGAAQASAFGRADAFSAWRVPDRIARRTPAALRPAEREAATAFLRTRLDPLWKTFEEQPIEYSPYFEVGAGLVLNREQTTTHDDPEDGLWTVVELPGILHDPTRRRLLVSHTYSEDPEGIVMGVAVPNGTYHVWAFGTTLPGEAGRGSSFSFHRVGIELSRAEVERNPSIPLDKLDLEAEEPRVFSTPPSKTRTPSEKWHELGVYTISNDMFVYYLDDGDPEDVTVMGGLRFLAVGHEEEAPRTEVSAEVVQRLRELGYLSQEDEP